MKRALIITTALMVISFLTNIYFYSIFKSQYRTFNKLRLSPLNLKSHNTDGKYHKLLIYGDSHAQKWITPPISDVVNYGIGGQTTKQLLLRSDHHLSDIKTDYTIIFAGGNDIKIIASMPELSNQIVNDAITNIQSLIQKVNSKTVILCTIPPVFKMPYRYYALNYNAALKAQDDLNEKIRKLSSNKIFILDTFEIFKTAGEFRTQEIGLFDYYSTVFFLSTNISLNNFRFLACARMHTHVY